VEQLAEKIGSRLIVDNTQAFYAQPLEDIDTFYTCRKFFGVDMVPYVIKAALGEDCSDLKMAPVKGYWSNYMAHANETGKYAGIEYDDNFKRNHLVDFVTDIKEGDFVHKYRDAQDCVGELLLRYNNAEQMNDIIENMDKYVRIMVKS